MNTKHLALAVAIGAILGAPAAYVIAGSNTEPMPITPIDPISVDTSPDRTMIDTARRAADTLETNQINRLGVDFSTDGKKPPVLGGVTDSSGDYSPPYLAQVTDPCVINPNLASCRADLSCIQIGGTWSAGKCSFPSSGGGAGIGVKPKISWSSYNNFTNYKTTAWSDGNTIYLTVETTSKIPGYPTTKTAPAVIGAMIGSYIFDQYKISSYEVTATCGGCDQGDTVEWVYRKW